jgi:hypothetical protein
MRVDVNRCSFFVIVLCVACSDGDAADDGAESADQREEEAAVGSVGDELALSSLSVGQRNAICTEFELAEEPVVDKYDEVLCTLRALRAAELGLSDCDSFRSACLDDEGEGDTDDAQEEDEEEEEEDCPVPAKISCSDVTVGELRACVAALVDRDEQAGKLATDLKLTCASDLPVDLDDALPNACAVLRSRCPALEFEDEAS